MNKQAKIATLSALILVGAILAIAVLAAPKQCNDRLDNDGDGSIDYPADPGCSSKTDNDEHSSSLICDNGLDETNDADRLADYKLTGGDPGCISSTDTSEIDGQCDDLIDNDGDGHSDHVAFGDSKCTSFSDNDESPRDSCSDTDGGFAIGLQGTISGDDESIPYNYTDFCLNTTIVNEYGCGGPSLDYAPLSYPMACTGNTTSCINGACV